MITKILFTALVIVGVIVFYRMRSRNDVPKTSTPTTHPKFDPAHLVAYAVVAVLIAITGVIYVLNRADDHRLVNIRVINTRTGHTVIYQAYQNKIDGRSFETTDGRSVTLSEVERVETTMAE